MSANFKGKTACMSAKFNKRYQLALSMQAELTKWMVCILNRHERNILEVLFSDAY